MKYQPATVARLFVMRVFPTKFDEVLNGPDFLAPIVELEASTVFPGEIINNGDNPWFRSQPNEFPHGQRPLCSLLRSQRDWVTVVVNALVKGFPSADALLCLQWSETSIGWDEIMGNGSHRDPLLCHKQRSKGELVLSATEATVAHIACGLD